MMKTTAIIAAIVAASVASIVLVGCSSSPMGDGGDLAQASPDLFAEKLDLAQPASQPIDLASAAQDLSDSANRDLSSPASPDMTPAVTDPSNWALYTLAPGSHSATVKNAATGNPLAGLVTGTSGRDFDFVFDPSAMYTITMPTEPSDQLDWNKLPGLSDCNQVDLSVDGVMFGWRWRLDLTPKVLEVTAYANDASKHLWPNDPLITLDADDLASLTPLHYRQWMDGANYHFTIDGTIRGRVINVSTSLPRQCATTTPSSLFLQWAAGFYFGGTSTAPSTITGRIYERPFH